MNVQFRALRALSLLSFIVLGTLLAQAGNITVQNASFESANLPDNSGNGNFSQLVPNSLLGQADGTLPDWAVTFATMADAAGGFAPNNGPNNWTTPWWDGNNVAYLEVDGDGSTVSLSQVLAATLQNNTQYTLSSLIGRRKLPNFSTEFDYDLELWAGNTMLGSASNLSLARDSSGMDSLVYNSGSSNALAGQQLKIVLSSTGGGDEGLTEVFFDDISLDG